MAEGDVTSGVDLTRKVLSMLNEAESGKPATPKAEQQAKAINEEPKEVHSMESLHASRIYNLQLLSLLPDYQRTELAVKCIDTELELQNSIKAESYFGAETRLSVAKVLTYTFTGAAILFVVVFFVVLILAQVIKGSVDQKVLTALTYPALLLLFFLGIAALGHLFPKSTKAATEFLASKWPSPKRSS